MKHQVSICGLGSGSFGRAAGKPLAYLTSPATACKVTAAQLESREACVNSIRVHGRIVYRMDDRILVFSQIEDLSLCPADVKNHLLKTAFPL